MDFFQHQDDARRKTGRMVFLFLLAVISIVAALNAVFAGIFIYGAGEITQQGQSLSLSDQIEAVPTELFFWVSGITLLVIIGGSLYRIAQLNDGGIDRVFAVAIEQQAQAPPRQPPDPGRCSAPAQPH